MTGPPAESRAEEACRLAGRRASYGGTLGKAGRAQAHGVPRAVGGPRNRVRLLGACPGLGIELWGQRIS